MQGSENSSHSVDLEKEVARLERENRRLQRKIVNMQDMQNRSRDIAQDNQAVDRVRDEEKQKQDRYMRLLKANVPDIILMFDRDGLLINYTDSFLEAIGARGFSQVAGKHSAEIMAEYSLASSQDAESTFAEVIAHGTTFATEARFDFAKDGVGRNYEVLTVPITDDEGTTEGAVSLLHDITELVQRERMVNALYEMATRFLSQDIETFEETMTEGISLLIDLLDLDRVSLWRNSQEDKGLYASQVYRWKREQEAAVSMTLGGISLPYADIKKQWGELVSEGGTVNLLARDLSEESLFHQFGSNSLFVAPIHTDNEFWGFVIFEDIKSDRIFSASETSILQSAALMMSEAINSHEEAIRVYDADERMRLLLDATPMGCQILDAQGKTIDCNQADVELFGFKDKTEFLARVQDIWSPEFQPDGRPSKEKATECIQRAFKEGRYTFEWMHQTVDGTPLPCNVTLVRVRYKDEDVLASYVWDLRLTRRMEEDIKHLESEVTKIYLDPLTGIHNRRYFEETMSDTIALLSRSGADTTLSLLMIDIDSFKPYNDTYGHTRGDKCLIEVAHAIEENLVRKNDFVARYGGEEFVVVLPNADEKGARKVAEKLLESVRARAIPHVASRAADHVTVSIGITTGTVDHTQSSEAYVKRADEMLYQAKREGGDCSFFAELE